MGQLALEAKVAPSEKLQKQEKRKSAKIDGDNHDDNEVTTEQKIRKMGLKKPAPLYYIGGGNGAHLVDEKLSGMGWERIYDKNRDDYRLKWCEVKANNQYHSFREGEQFCYQIPNNKLLTSKIGLLTSLQEYDRVMNKVKKGRPSAWSTSRLEVCSSASSAKKKIMHYRDFFPETYRMDLRDEREIFFENYADGDIWISKPTGLNQGKGIYLIKNREEVERLQERYQERMDDSDSPRKQPFRVPMARIVQRYVRNPLLLDGHKFDVRNYMLVACANPFVVLYGDGYCRLTCQTYDESSDDLSGHLTNQFVQKKNPLYEEMKEETVWSMDSFNDYVNENFAAENNLPDNWVHTVLRRKCQAIMLHCFQSVRHKLESRLGFFDLIGCDFLIHTDFKVSLLEMNCNPALHTNCETLKEVIPNIVTETIDLALEVFDKQKKKERVCPLKAQKHFTLLYNGDSIEAAERRERMQSAAEARKRASSEQRRKRFNASQYIYRRNQNPTPSTTTASDTSTTNNTTSSTVTSSFQTATRQRLANTVQSKVYNNNNSNTKVTGSKSQPNVTVKPFYAGGSSLSSRPYSAKSKFKSKKYNQVEARVDTRINGGTDSKARNNASLQAASQSKAVTEMQPCKARGGKQKHSQQYVLSHKRKDGGSSSKPRRKSGGGQKKKEVAAARKVQKAKNELLSSQREADDVTAAGVVKSTNPNQVSEAEIEEFIEGVKEELDTMEKDHMFDQILEEDEELEEIIDDDGDDDDEDILTIGGAITTSFDNLRRPSAKLPPNYHHHSNVTEYNLVPAAAVTSWPKYPSSGGKSDGTLRKKVTKIASLAVKGQARNSTTDLPLPYVGSIPASPRRNSDTQVKSLTPHYRTPTTVRVRHSLPATTCTLEIGPKSRRGLVAVKPAVVGVSEKSSPRKQPQHTKLKMMTISPAPSDTDMISPAVLLSMATAHIQSSPRISQPEAIVTNAINNNVTNAIVNNDVINSAVVANALSSDHKTSSLVLSDPPGLDATATGSLVLNEPVPIPRVSSKHEVSPSPQLDVPVYRHALINTQNRVLSLAKSKAAALDSGTTPRPSGGIGEEQVIWRLRSRTTVDGGKPETVKTSKKSSKSNNSNGTQTPIYSSRRMLSGMEGTLSQWKEQSDPKSILKKGKTPPPIHAGAAVSSDGRRRADQTQNIINNLPKDMKSQAKILADLVAPLTNHSPKSSKHDRVLKRNEVVSFTAG